MLALASTASLALVACTPRARMCTASSECQTARACVAGRCQREGKGVVLAITSAERRVVLPVDVGYLRRGDDGSGPRSPRLASTFVLGDGEARLLLRFSLELPKDARVVEAYVVLHRADGAQRATSPLGLRADSIEGAWTGRTLSWASAPPIRDARQPLTVVSPGGPGLVRLDVGALVRGWAGHDARDHGIAIVSERAPGEATTFTLRRTFREGPGDATAGGVFGDDDGPGARARVSLDAGPYLELYLAMPNSTTRQKSPNLGPNRPKTAAAGPHLQESRVACESVAEPVRRTDASGPT